ncbi:hypothetical protein GCM10009809_03450 [Isoptericola hypogeus]|uniref:N-acetylmuramoyl-L-alanine amidase n=1 Tax=Isoptericola hypogeus TaxID=300179 RepID=A0ABN2IRP5_9MICO
MSRWGRIGGAGIVVVALALGGVILPTVTLPVAEAHAVPPDVESVPVRGVDRAARAQSGALAAAEGAERPEHAAVQGRGSGAGDDDGAGSLAALSPQTATQDFLVAGVTWAADRGSEVTEVAVRLREEGGWGDWRALGLDGMVTEDGRTGTEPVTSTGADGVQVRVRTADGAPPSGLKVDVVDPGTSAADARVGADPAPASSASAATGREIRPSIVTRSEWGADESLLGSWPTVSGELDAIYVHHTAGTNAYSRSQSAAIVRGIYAYHTKSRGWPDIGYQFLVDRFGRVFQGRSGAVHDNPIGAHAGGYNTGTIGVSAMGDFESARPTSALKHSLMRVIAWKAYQYGLAPQGHVTLPTGDSAGSTTRARPGTNVRVPTITMHRTTNHTTCPGRHLAAYLPALRDAVQAKVARAKDHYGTVRPAVGRPNGSSPAGQVPAQWKKSVTYTWSKVTGASRYQVLTRYAGWKQDMPDSRYWRVHTSTTRRSITIPTSIGWTRQVAVRAISGSELRGPIERISRSSRPVPASQWARSNSWKKHSSDRYYGGVAYWTRSKHAAIRLSGAKEVRSVRVVASTGPGFGRVQVRVNDRAVGSFDLASRTFQPRKTFAVTLPRGVDGEVRLRTLDGKEVRISAIALARR